MVRPDRRHLILGAMALPLAGFAAPSARAEAPRDLAWRDLLPEGDASLPGDLQGIVPHDESAMAAGQPPSTGIRSDLNGEVVRLSGFVVPIDQGAEGIMAFILVPYVGAGAGLVFTRLTTTAPGSPVEIKGSDTNFGFQAMAGVDYKILPRWRLGVGYKYQMVFGTDYDIKLSGTNTNVGRAKLGTIDSHTILMKLTYQF